MADDDHAESDKAGSGEWDTARAAALIGKYVIAGFLYADGEGTSQRSPFQFHGVIVDASPDKGFALSLRGSRVGETVMLPAKLDAFVEATPGRYRLKGTNEVVYDPDYVSLWTMPVSH
jgi:hypothetical protein